MGQIIVLKPKTNVPAEARSGKDYFKFPWYSGPSPHDPPFSLRAKNGNPITVKFCGSSIRIGGEVLGLLVYPDGKLKVDLDGINSDLAVDYLREFVDLLPQLWAWGQGYLADRRKGNARPARRALREAGLL